MKDENGTKIIAGFFLKVFAGISVTLIGSGIVWLVYTTQVSSSDMKVIKSTLQERTELWYVLTTNVHQLNWRMNEQWLLLRKTNERLENIPKEFPPKEYRKTVEDRLDRIEFLVRSNAVKLDGAARQ